jgi:hypothetical protein
MSRYTRRATTSSSVGAIRTFKSALTSRQVVEAGR